MPLPLFSLGIPVDTHPDRLSAVQPPAAPLRGFRFLPVTAVTVSGDSSFYEPWVAFRDPASILLGCSQGICYKVVIDITYLNRSEDSFSCFLLPPLCCKTLEPSPGVLQCQFWTQLFLYRYLWGQLTKRKNRTLSPWCANLYALRGPQNVVETRNTAQRT